MPSFGDKGLPGSLANDESLISQYLLVASRGLARLGSGPRGCQGESSLFPGWDSSTHDSQVRDPAHGQACRKAGVACDALRERFLRGGIPPTRARRHRQARGAWRRGRRATRGHRTPAGLAGVSATVQSGVAGGPGEDCRRRQWRDTSVAPWRGGVRRAGRGEAGGDERAAGVPREACAWWAPGRPLPSQQDGRE